jgi:hypothetical protein
MSKRKVFLYHPFLYPIYPMSIAFMTLKLFQYSTLIDSKTKLSQSKSIGRTKKSLDSIISIVLRMVDI